jgi:hypothetical protein
MNSGSVLMTRSIQDGLKSANSFVIYAAAVVCRFIQSNGTFRCVSVSKSIAENTEKN